MAPTHKRVLIVEDEKPLSHALLLKLEHEGCKVSVANNGQQCLDLIESEGFDVVLLDLMMPVMDGFQVLERIGALEQRPVVFVLSNLSQREDEERVVALGAKKYFIKSDTPLSVIVDEVKKA
ncbi:MAG TPA: response regulator [Candidatus Saccharimonadales bacterium]|nr:response regulator [Candidatus Saccharimonadales bacterium]